jgi:hypothetical protein
MDVLTYKLLQSSCPLHLVRFLVCAFISFLRKLLIFLQYTFWSLVSDPVSHSLHSFLFFFFLLCGISPGHVRRFCELITWQLLQHWKVSEYLYLFYGKFFFKEIKNQNKFGLVDSRLASCTPFVEEWSTVSMLLATNPRWAIAWQSSARKCVLTDTLSLNPKNCGCIALAVRFLDCFAFPTGIEFHFWVPVNALVVANASRCTTFYIKLNCRRHQPHYR